MVKAKEKNAILAYWPQRPRNKRQENQAFMSETMDFE